MLTELFVLLIVFLSYGRCHGGSIFERSCTVMEFGSVNALKPDFYLIILYKLSPAFSNYGGVGKNFCFSIRRLIVLSVEKGILIYRYEDARSICIGRTLWPKLLKLNLADDF